MLQLFDNIERKINAIVNENMCTITCPCYTDAKAIYDSYDDSVFEYYGRVKDISQETKYKKALYWGSSLDEPEYTLKQFARDNSLSPFVAFETFFDCYKFHKENSEDPNWSAFYDSAGVDFSQLEDKDMEMVE